MMRALIIAALAGALSGAMFVLPLVGSMIGLLLANFTHFPLFLVGLSLGTGAAVVAAVAGTVVVGLLAHWLFALSFIAVFAVPAVLLVRQAVLWRALPDGSVEWYPPGRLMMLMTGYGVALFVLAMIFFGGHEGGLEGVMREGARDVMVMFGSDLPEHELAARAVPWGSLLPGLIIVSWLATVMVNAALAQATLSWRGRAIRPSLDLAAIELPLAFAYALAVSLGLWVLGGSVFAFIGKTLTLIVAMAYVFQGLGVVHLVTRGWPGRGFLLTFFYLVFFVFLGWIGLALVAGVGLVDQLIGLRRRLARRGADKEDE